MPQDFEFEFKYPSGYAFYRRVTALLRDGCTKVGIRLSENPLEWSVFLEQYLDQNFEAVTLGVSHSDPWHDPYRFHGRDWSFTLIFGAAQRTARTA